MKLPSLGDWGLHLLALILAIVVYHLVKTGSTYPNSPSNDRTFFHH